MEYDIVGGYGRIEDDYQEPYTLEGLIKVLEVNSDKFVVFVGTRSKSIGYLCSWRGSYDIPAITYDGEVRKAGVIAEELQEALKKEHYGYKGGQYKYEKDDTFYVSERGTSEEYKIVGFEVQDDKLILLTKIYPY